MKITMPRRKFLSQTSMGAAALGALGATPLLRGQSEPKPAAAVTARDYLVDFMNQRGLPFVDLMKEHLDDFAQYQSDIKDYVAKHWVGHYNPRGNHFCAFAILPALIALLDPKPMSYRANAALMK
jgi:hypothetical protein